MQLASDTFIYLLINLFACDKYIQYNWITSHSIGLNIYYFITHWKWIKQNATTLFPTYNTNARTFTQCTTREEMKIDITHTHIHTHTNTHSHTRACAHKHTLTDYHLHNPPPELHKTLYQDHTISLFVSKIYSLTHQYYYRTTL